MWERLAVTIVSCITRRQAVHAGVRNACMIPPQAARKQREARLSKSSSAATAG